MTGVLEHRREYLRLMRQQTLDKGFFSVTDIQQSAKIPRSTAQDWINRLVREGCVFIREEKRGRSAARYAAISAVPTSTCRRIFTTVDGDNVEIYHDCMSGACAAFCGYHHALAAGVLSHIQRDGTLLRECARIGYQDVPVGLEPLPAVGVIGVERSGDLVIQKIRCIGGPAYSLSGMMVRAEGVMRVDSHHLGQIVEGDVWTRAMIHVTIGIDDTDSKDGGATFALALALLSHVNRINGVLPISHNIVMLNPDVFIKTGGNSASFIEVAVMPDHLENLSDKVRRFVADESLSHEWCVAMRTGLGVSRPLREYGKLVREQVISRTIAEATAENYDIFLTGGNGVIGALAAIALAGLPNEILLDPKQNIFPEC
ncbi:MAG: sugar-specific transcriptional regulator TrmB [Methanomicrobiales archaeon]